MEKVERRRTRKAKTAWLTPQEFADRLGVTRWRVYKWMERGHLETYVIGPASKPVYLINERETASVQHLLERG